MAPHLHTVQSYLDTLPAGLASYPQCSSKMSSLLFQLRRRPLRGLAGLPDEVVEVVGDPPVATAWIPTTVFIATTLAIEAEHGITDVTLAIESTEDMLESSLYRFTLRLLTPSMILRAGAATWGMFHRGSTFKARAVAGALEATLEFPPMLLPQEILQGFAAGFEAICRAS
ncbi:MAG: hypothetical protein IPM79_12940 [Polyangiaceae bacterium]|nr:hypothetical protein [Polyangiaceae bacterium]